MILDYAQDLGMAIDAATILAKYHSPTGRLFPWDGGEYDSDEHEASEDVLKFLYDLRDQLPKEQQREVNKHVQDQAW